MIKSSFGKSIKSLKSKKQPQKKKAIPKPAKRINSRAKGCTFEREIARDLRGIYDSPRLLKELDKALPRKEHAALLKRSRVRRSDQGKGAMEPDLVIQDCPFWFELTHAAKPDPMAKLKQAERDSQIAEGQWLPVAIVKKTHGTFIQAWMRTSTFLVLCGFDHLTDSAGVDIPLSSAPNGNMPVMISYSDLISRLKAYEGPRAE